MPFCDMEARTNRTAIAADWPLTVHELLTPSRIGPARRRGQDQQASGHRKILGWVVGGPGDAMPHDPSAAGPIQPPSVRGPPAVEACRERVATREPAQFA